MIDHAQTFGLFRLAEVLDEMRKRCAELKWRALKAEGELNEIRMRLHQVGMKDPRVKAEALNYLKAEAEDYRRRLEECPF